MIISTEFEASPTRATLNLRSQLRRIFLRSDNVAEMFSGSGCSGRVLKFCPQLRKKEYMNPMMELRESLALGTLSNRNGRVGKTFGLGPARPKNGYSSTLSLVKAVTRSSEPPNKPHGKLPPTISGISLVLDEAAPPSNLGDNGVDGWGNAGLRTLFRIATAFFMCSIAPNSWP